MSDDHVEAFLVEADERIAELNESLLSFEADPGDRESIDAVFRTAHTLKGNFAAMGFEEQSRLAHALEDLLDELRGERLDPSPEVMDLAFQGVDGIEASVRAIESGGEAVPIEPTVAAIRATLDGDTGLVSDPELEPSERADARALFEACGDDESVFEAAVVPREGAMASVESMLAAESIAAAFDRVAFKCESDDLSGPFSAWIVATGIGEIEAAIDEIGRIESVTVERSEPPAEDGNTTGRTDSTGDSTGIRTVRVDVDQLDELHGLVEQLVTSRIELRRAAETGGGSMADAIDELDTICATIQSVVTDVRLIPLETVASRLPRLVRDLAHQEGKAIEFSMTGEGVELDRTILSQLGDPLMHVLRNAVDHGIEPPEERVRAGKSETGTIELRARRERDHAIVEVEDDGRGLDRGTIEAKAIETGVATAAELAEYSSEAVYELLFHPGFSTAEEITEVSGRGVGMDVVHSTVEALDGRIDVESEPGEGTLVRLCLPVTVATVTVLFVAVGEESYGIPIRAVDEIGRADGIRTINGEDVIEHDGEIYPVIELRETLDVEGTDPGEMLVRVRRTERAVALRCDDVCRQEEVLVKPLDGDLGSTAGVGGTAVLGDGETVPILDVRGL
ncbi:chemotaxis protein CheA [Halalkalicoccus subterraneus]|uniref:chemotaxis protein CheA n=1 Tax=Halalkalicoccus subterraneus TaxID=2675002 RepID=UPI000EFA822A|nr:chemotaxis protein CheA [Halalkalicoccus subterraneus]